ncbi:glycine zipper family protein [Roseomonas sp. CCTCC AB2023176]|uniref:glycine zipper family protein n=1 Tax=Roseomonas sp. CCTCC AB2023176 TaxID=3342640 RepID=UPI0035DA35EF
MSGKKIVPLAALLGLSACAVVPPSAPSVYVLPPAGKDYAQFQREDLGCRAQAQAQVGDVTGAQLASNNTAVGNAAVGTALGAVAGLAIGSLTGNAGAGAAIGAGTGLVAGSATGANAAAATSGGLQRQYDVVYLQCMTAAGNTPPPAPTVAVVPGAPYYGYVGPSVGLGFGFYGGRYYYPHRYGYYRGW